MTTELTLQERASNALAIKQTRGQLIAMAEKTKDVSEIKDKADYEMVKSAQIGLRDVRVIIQRVGKSARDDANQFAKAIIAEEHDLVSLISPEEFRLKSLRKVVDDKVALAKAAEAAAESARIEGFQAQIKAIHLLALGAGTTLESIDERIAQVLDIDLTQFEEFADAAKFAKAAVLETLQQARNERVILDEQQATAAEVAAGQAEQQRILDEEQEAIDKEKAAIENERQRINSEKQEAERAENFRVQKAEQARLHEEMVERQRLQAIKDHDTKVAADAKEAERKEKLKPEAERLAGWGQMLKDIEPPKNIRTKSGKKLVAEVLKDLGEMGNAIISTSRDL
jgi:hypothetical protein